MESDIRPLDDGDLMTFFKKYFYPSYSDYDVIEIKTSDATAMQNLHDLLFNFSKKKMIVILFMKPKSDFIKVGHWTMMILPENFYYDSAHLSPRQMKKWFDIPIWFPNNIKPTNKMQLQEYEDVVCGYWLEGFIVIMFDLIDSKNPTKFNNFLKLKMQADGKNFNLPRQNLFKLLEPFQ